MHSKPQFMTESEFALGLEFLSSLVAFEPSSSIRLRRDQRDSQSQLQLGRTTACRVAVKGLLQKGGSGASDGQEKTGKESSQKTYLWLFRKCIVDPHKERGIYGEYKKTSRAAKPMLFGCCRTQTKPFQHWHTLQPTPPIAWPCNLEP